MKTKMKCVDGDGVRARAFTRRSETESEKKNVSAKYISDIWKHLIMMQIYFWRKRHLVKMN